MKIGIIFAMQEELKAIDMYFKEEEIHKIYELEFHEGKIEDTKCILVESGIGKVNSARTTQILIDKFNVDYILNVGVAGGIDESLDVCDIVVSDKLIQHDFDITAFNHKKGYIPNIGDYISVSEELLNISKKINFQNIRYGVIASGDIFCTDKLMAEKINKKFNALCVEMEGASIAQVCYLCNVPFLVIRSISDVPNNHNKITYEEFLEKSTIVVACYVNEFIKKISELKN